MTIEIKKHDALHIKIVCDDRSVILGLKDYFTDFVEGFRFMPRYKAGGGWNGKICLVMAGNVLPYGNLFDVLKFLKTSHPEKPLSIDQDVKDLFLGEEIDPEFNLQIFPRPYQIECILACLKFKKGIIVAATASGKSCSIAYIIKTLMDNYLATKTLIIVPTISLCLQMYKDFKEYGIEIPIDVRFSNSKLYKKIKITLENGDIILKNIDDIVETKRGKIKAKDVIKSDEII